MQNNRIYRLVISLCVVAFSSFSQMTKEQYEDHVKSKIESIHVDYKASTYMYKAGNDMIFAVVFPLVGAALGSALLIASPTEPVTGLLVVGAGVGLGTMFSIKAGINFRKASKSLKDANL